jgi:hypothetical protein
MLLGMNMLLPDRLRDNQLVPVTNKSDGARTLAKRILLCLEIRKHQRKSQLGKCVGDVGLVMTSRLVGSNVIVSETGEPEVNSPIADNSEVNGQSAFMRTQLISCCPPNAVAPYCGRRSFTACAIFVSFLGQVDLCRRGSPFADASDPAGSRNGSTEMRSYLTSSTVRYSVPPGS